MSSDSVLFPFIDPAVQIIVVCAAGLVLLFFLSALSDALRMRGQRRVAACTPAATHHGHATRSDCQAIPR